VGIKLSKLSNKGTHCLFLGYAEEHPKDTYRVLDLKNQLGMLTRNVRWLGKTHGEFFNGEEPKNIENTDLESSDEEEIRFEASPSTSQIVEEKKEPPKFTMITRSRALMDDMEDEETDSEEEMEGDRLMMIEESYVNNPRSFSEAFYHPEKEKQKGWREAIKKELNSMGKKCKVWTVLSKEELPKDRKLIGNQWVFA
jgi:hypothetical protein